MDIILASSSPRRRELLKLITEDFTVEVSDCDEEQGKNLPPEEYCMATAAAKARAVAQNHRDAVVIGADTIVVKNGEILGKPHDTEDAVKMLEKLSGGAHNVLTAVCLCTAKGEQSFISSTEVIFEKMSPTQIATYAASGEPMDKAGAYGIQGGAAKFISGIKGDYFTVMGLPVQKLFAAMENILEEMPPKL